NLMLHHRIACGHEMPRLQVCSARRRSCSTDAILNHFARYRAIGKIPKRPPALHHFVKFPRAPEYFVVRVVVDLRRRYEARRCHRFSVRELPRRIQIDLNLTPLVAKCFQMVVLTTRPLAISMQPRPAGGTRPPDRKSSLA